MLLKTLLEIVAETGSSTKFEEVVRIGSPALNHVGLLLSPQQPPPSPRDGRVHLSSLRHFLSTQVL